MGKLDGRVAIITGGSGGIGRAAAKRFVDEGANVLLVDLEERALRDSVNAIGEKHASWICADVTSDDDTQGYVKAAVERYGRIDILLANAGIEGNFKPIPEYPIEVFDRVIAVNVRGVWLGLKHVIPAMAKGGSGDILTGIVAAMLAQFPGDVARAVEAAVYLHGLAADFAAHAMDEHTVLATDTVTHLSDAFRYRVEDEGGLIWICGLRV